MTRLQCATYTIGNRTDDTKIIDLHQYIVSPIQHGIGKFRRFQRQSRQKEYDDNGHPGCRNVGF